MIKKVEQMNMTERWQWLKDHPSFNMSEGEDGLPWEALPMGLDVDFVMVDPETEMIEDDPNRNTAVRCWLEFGPFWIAEEDPNWPRDEVLHSPMVSHDTDLDSGGPTFEEAFLELCLKVLEHYGDYERKQP